MGNVKRSPKWKTNALLLGSSKKTKINESNAYTSSSNIDTSLDKDDNKVEVHPIGQKAAKAKIKAKRKTKSSITGKNMGIKHLDSVIIKDALTQ